MIDILWFSLSEITPLYVTSIGEVNGAPDGYLSKGKYLRINMYKDQDQLIEHFASPVKVCYILASHQIDNFAEKDLGIGTAANARSLWRILNGGFDAKNQMGCAFVEHFSLFGLFAKIKDEVIPATGFAPGVVTDLEQQTSLNKYQNLGGL
ncbi:MAG: hypothetical protein LLG42_14445 [Chloroflexi bacterium]|nr:hypothetical protein [Chloroflexota bacterium]